MVFLLAALALPATAQATWSVIAVDRSTGRVVIASATCVNGDDMFLPGVQAVVVPGKGVAACQAAVDRTHQNQMLVYEELKKGTDPAAIVEMLSKDPAFASRQFGIVDLQGRAAGHSGDRNGKVSENVSGQVTGTEIFYSIQGNILRPGEVVPNAVKAFVGAKGAMTDRVMAAMEAADAAGGDSRCSCPPLPTDGVRGKDGARRLHPDGGEDRHQWRLPQQWSVRDVPARVAARQGRECDPRGREPESGEDAAAALRRVAEDAAGIVQMRISSCH